METVKDLKGRVYGASDVYKILKTYPNWQHRFWPKVEKTAFCWFWKAGTNDKGYGVFATEARRGKVNLEYAHRLTWFLANKVSIPEGYVIDHECQNRNCCNPDHLQAIPIKENSAQHVRHRLKPLCKQCGTEREWIGKRHLRLVCKNCRKKHKSDYNQRQRLLGREAMR